MQDLALVVFPDFEYNGKQPITHPADGKILLRNVGAPVEPVRRENNSRTSSNPMPRLGFVRSLALLRASKLKRMWCYCYTILRRAPRCAEGLPGALAALRAVHGEEMLPIFFVTAGYSSRRSS